MKFQNEALAALALAGCAIAGPVKRDAGRTKCWTGNELNQAHGEEAMKQLLAGIEEGKDLKVDECRITRSDMTMAKVCNNGEAPRSITKADVETYFKAVTDKCSQNAGVHTQDAWTTYLFVTRPLKRSELEAMGVTDEEQQQTQPPPAARLKLPKRGRSQWSNKPGGICHEIMGNVVFKDHPQEYKCNFNPINADGSCPVGPHNSDETQDCAAYCETKRTFYWDAPVDWEPSRDPVCDTDSITLQSSKTQNTGISYNGGISVGDPYGVFQGQVSVSYYKEVGNTLGVEWALELKNKGEVCARAVRIAPMVESCGSITKGFQYTVPDAGFNCDFFRLKTQQNACTYWEYTSSSGKSVGMNTVEYVWDGQNTHNGAIGELAPPEYQTPEYNCVGKGKPPVVVNP